MLTTVEGVYKQGQIELSETPPGVQEARVIVVFLDANGQGSPQTEAKAAPQYLRHGQFPELKSVTEEDFRMAEWHGDPDDELCAPGDDL
ncbi:MAG: hypothetical protein M3347_16130 [Armatimonadota bacterium]|nr:hypothetical protein [Armatimonadota bacterium]